MVDRGHERYRQALKHLRKSCDCHSRAGQPPADVQDWNERAAAYHDLYVIERDQEARWEACEAARRALRRLDEGTFGRCVDCGQQIGRRRLEAMPWAARCLPCQLSREHLDRLPQAA